MRVLHALLDYLAAAQPSQDQAWQDWQIRPVTGGRNNLLYRTRGPLGDLAVKFTIEDGRDRAGREHESQSALRRAGLAIAPQPVLLERATYRHPVIVSTWLEGTVSALPPRTDAGWRSLVQHLALVHSVVPVHRAANLRPPALHAATAEDGKQLVGWQAARLQGEHPPDEDLAAPLRALLHRLEARRFPEWSPPPVTLCRLDNNVANYIRRPGLWASVDWEYSGWGDPAFDVANLVTHVAYLDVPAPRWEWVIGTYCGLVTDPEVAVRIQAYREILLAWWVARLACYLYEIPRGLDNRLADWPEGWQADIRAKYEHYRQLAEEALH